MPRELEAKLPLADPAALRARLAELGSPPAERFTENNRFFDLPGEPLGRSEQALRLRTQTPWPPPGQRVPGGPERHWLTHKGPREGAAGAGLKCREETEAEVADAGEAAAVFKALGYRQRFRFEKRRERHLFAGCRVEIDELPGLGFFVEVEGPDAVAIESALTQLGLGRAPREQRGYRTLLLEGAPAAPAPPAPHPPAEANTGPAFLFPRPAGTPRGQALP